MQIKTIIISGIRLICKVLPLKKRILISSYWGMQKSDSPYQIYKYIKNKYPKAKIVFFHGENKGSLSSSQYPIKFWLYKSTSKVVVDNLLAANDSWILKDFNLKKDRINIFLNKKQGQKYVTTWHGTPLKKIGTDLQRSDGLNREIYVHQPMYLILGNTYTSTIMDNILSGRAEVKLFGSPRNDILIKCGYEKLLKIKEKLLLPQDKYIVLYAPTFRSGMDLSKSYVELSGIEQMDIFDFDRLFHILQERFGGEWVMVLRFHHLVSNMVDWKELEEKYPNRFINGNLYDDIAEYLLCSDVLITDYSSCMFDYAILNRPVFLFCHDLKHYGNEERGFYMDIEKLPFPLAEDFDSLYDNIKNFDNEVYCGELEGMKKQMGYCEDGDATEKAGDFIYRLLEDD